MELILFKNGTNSVQVKSRCGVSPSDHCRQQTNKEKTNFGSHLLILRQPGETKLFKIYESLTYF
jgi:hypothetical protein